MPGEGPPTRGFCQVANVVGTSSLAVTTRVPEALGSWFNVGTGARTMLLDLRATSLEAVRAARLDPAERFGHAPEFGSYRAGDVWHFCADVGPARRVLGFELVVGMSEGVAWTLAWFAWGQLR